MKYQLLLKMWQINGKRPLKILLVVSSILFLFLLAACSTERIVYQQVKCPNLVRPSMKVVDDLVQWNALIERTYQKCGNTTISKLH